MPGNEIVALTEEHVRGVVQEQGAEKDTWILEWGRKLRNYKLYDLYLTK